MRIIWRDCEHCGRAFSQPDDPGRKRRFCADACKQAAYRARKRYADQARRRAEEDAARRSKAEQLWAKYGLRAVAKEVLP
jgi:hypothetical protein